IKQCLPCNDDPVANFSAEGADSDRFLFIFREYLPPPLDFGIGDAYGTGFCWSEISLQDAQDCARQHADDDAAGSDTDPQGNPPRICLNTAQSCTVRCSAGSPFT